MKYFLDTEFLEGPQNQYLFGFKTPIVGPNTIDLISIGIVTEDIDEPLMKLNYIYNQTIKTHREYYAISKDFNLKEAWNRYDIKLKGPYNSKGTATEVKVYWIRENVLKPIYIELHDKEWNDWSKGRRLNVLIDMPQHKFTYKNLKRLINRYGKTNKDIAVEIQEFIYGFGIKGYDTKTQKETTRNLIANYKEPIEFYAYYADYDWVVFCWLFGKMMNLPNGFPMYCKDLKQDFDFYNENFKERKKRNALDQKFIDLKISNYKEHPNYPKQDPSKSHNAIEDARWNKQLFEFLNKL